MDPFDLCFGFYGFSIISPYLLCPPEAPVLVDFWKISESCLSEFTGNELYHLLRSVSRLKLRPPHNWMFSVIDSIPKKQYHPALYGRFLACMSTIKELIDPLYFQDKSK